MEFDLCFGFEKNIFYYWLDRDLEVDLLSYEGIYENIGFGFKMFLWVLSMGW